MIYLASPYSADEERIKEERYQAAIDKCAELILQGEIVFSPIVHGHVIARKHNLPESTAFWVAHNEAMIFRCNEVYVLMLPGWENSIGVSREIKFAAKLGRKVSYVTL